MDLGHATKQVRGLGPRLINLLGPIMKVKIVILIRPRLGAIWAKHTCVGSGSETGSNRSQISTASSCASSDLRNPRGVRHFPAAEVTE